MGAFQRRRKIILASALAAILFLVGCGSSGSAGGGESAPRQAAEQFLAACNARDTETFLELLDDGYEEDSGLPVPFTPEMLAETLDGKSDLIFSEIAVADPDDLGPVMEGYAVAQVTDSGGELNESITLELVNGKWIVQGFSMLPVIWR